MPKYRPEEITYELFGIDPEKFYAKLFSYGAAQPDLLADPASKYLNSRQKQRLLVEALRRLLPGGGDVLDVGCGSGPFGPTILAHAPGVRLFGVDMSRECVQQACANGYAGGEACDFVSGLPYPDGRFDAVISMDLLGHIEFRHKDRVIREIWRVTRPGGGGLHGVETTFVDYLNCNPADPNDPVRKYVHAQGHIGVEPARHAEKRFAACFSRVEWNITYLYPLLEFNNLANFDYFEKEFHELLRKHGKGPDAEILADLLLGRLNAYFIDVCQKAFGPAFRPYDQPWWEEQPPTGENPAADAVAAVARQLCRPGGFACFTVGK
jgi:ubiquinone/menaquinone biosynthesis C-methylase UbiE